MFKYIKQTEFNTNEVYNSMWKFDQQICQQIDFPVALDLGCKYLFSHIGDIFVSKDGKYCIAQTYRYVEKMLCIYELPYWIEIKRITLKKSQQIYYCYFTSDNQFALFEIKSLQNLGYEYYIYNFVQYEGKYFSFCNLSILQYWTTQENKLNLLINSNGKLELYQIDKEFKIQLIKSSQSYLENQIHSMKILERTSQKLQKYLRTNPKTTKNQQTDLHNNQFLFIQQYKKNTIETILRHICGKKIIRKIQGSYVYYVFIKNLFIWRDRLDLVFYDFTSGYVVQTLTCKIYKQLRELQIIGNHLALKEGDNYFGWLIK